MTTVREMTPGDAEAVLRLHVAAAREFGPRAYDQEQVAAWAEKPDGVEPYLAALEADTTDQIVAERDGEVIGWGRLDHDETDDEEGGDEDSTVGEVTAVYVDPEHARSGVGSALLAHLEERAAELGLDRLSLSASLNAVGFYERHGYRPVERTTHETTGGVELPVLAMTTDLASARERGHDAGTATDRE